MDADGRYMARAIELATRGWGRVSPNPMVGCVLVSTTGVVVGEGWHAGPGSPHAEAMAIEEAGELARGTTAFVTLEPCNRYGRTPPCTLALIEAGVAEVVVAATDPNLGEGAPGIHQLRDAGVAVRMGPLGAASRDLNVAFERHVATGRPFVVLKEAASLDGKTAAADGSSRWISSEAARTDVQRWRAWADAVVVGAGTAVHDDPALTVRDERWADARPPLRVVVDSTGRVPGAGRVFEGDAPTLVATTEAAPPASLDAWQAAGADVAVLDRDPNGGVLLDALLHELGKRDVQGCLVEGGPTLAWSLVRDDLVDRLVVYLAPKLVGGEHAPGLLMGEGFAPIGRARKLRIASVERIGEDVRVVADVHRDR